jgi:hypothetical protein
MIAVSCKKNHKELISGRLQGVWELRHVEGGFRAPGTSPDYAPGNGNMWKFSDSTYQYYVNGQLSVQGSYTLTKDISPATGKNMDALILDSNNNWKLFFEISNNTLTLYRGIVAADGTIETYEKIGN